jgi:hypothetical protein
MGLINPQRRPHYRPTDRLAILEVKAARGYVISDKGGQFTSAGFRAWCRRKGTLPRYGATGQIICLHRGNGLLLARNGQERDHL